MLKIENLVSGYGSVQILYGANMKVEKQSVVALLGGNGTGKSTILKACSGLLRSWEGTINFNGEDIHNLPPHEIVKKGLVQVTQGKDVFPAMSVTENLRLGAFVLNTKRELKDNLEKVFNYFPRLSERKSQLAATLSGGELQMLCIGRGLMSSPKMIMLDEPSAALSSSECGLLRRSHRTRPSRRIRPPSSSRCPRSCEAALQKNALRWVEPSCSGRFAGGGA